jgi:hypothetical protein
MRRPIALIAFLLTLSANAAAPQIAVPRALKAPKIDGTIAPNEWKGAVRVRMGEKAHALLLHDGNNLYIALIGREPGISSVCAVTGKQVLILHASAALGTAVFTQDQDKWLLKRGFTWTNRDSGQSARALAERKKTFSAEGWFANTNSNTLTDREFVLHVRFQPQIPLVLGHLTTSTANEQRLYYWPEEVVDGCAEPELATGYTDREYTFDPDSWGLAILQ